MAVEAGYIFYRIIDYKQHSRLRLLNQQYSIFVEDGYVNEIF